jgi:uncharacterized protein (TIGR03067 family)
MYRMLLSVTVLASIAAAAPFPKTIRSDAEALEGVWLRQSAQNCKLGLHGNLLGRQPSEIKWTITGDVLIETTNGANLCKSSLCESSFSLDESVNPKRLTLRVPVVLNLLRTYKMIYKLEGDMLTVCHDPGFPDHYPADFPRKADHHLVFHVFRRQHR